MCVSRAPACAKNAEPGLILKKPRAPRGFLWGCTPNPPYFFHCRKRPCGPHLAGRTLQAAGKKASTPSCRPQDNFICIRAFYNLFYQGLYPLPALLFFIAKKVSKKASPLGTYKTYFEPGVLQLPTVGQIKRLYIPFKIGFISRFKRGH